MKAAQITSGELQLVDIAKPTPKRDEALVRVSLTGICNTDHEILKGYVPGFSGIPGHEFVGMVEECADKSLVGKRITAEINVACGNCEFCSKGLGRHCYNRTVLGIINRNGAFSEYITVPIENCRTIPESISDAKAIFIEPLAAALEILEQVAIDESSNVLLFGDGKLGILIAFALSSIGCNLAIVGKHRHKLDLISNTNATTYLAEDFKADQYDIVIEATGNSTVFEQALRNVKPRGTIVLKSTYADAFPFNPSSIIVNEITIVGSRCGRFSEAITFLERYNPPVDSLISSACPKTQDFRTFPLDLS